MPSTFLGIETATRALHASQGVIDTIGHNLANVNTPGYSRQTVQLDESEPYMIPGMWRLVMPGQLGTGVEITSITRVQDSFLQDRLNSGNADQGKYDALSDGLDRVQQAYNEPGAGGLSNLITSFFNSFNEMSRTPENSGSRSLVRQAGEALAGQFQTVNNNLDQIDTDFKNRIGLAVDEVNRTSQSLAQLNVEIANSIAVGDHPNDLMDKRDVLIGQLANLVGARAVPETDANGIPTGNVNVSVGGYAIVQGNQAIALPTGYQMAGTTPELTDGTNVLSVPSGQVAGLIKAINLTEGYKADLNNIASNVIQKVNAQHQLGYGLDGNTGRNFFKGTDASTIAVDDAIENDVSAIAAASAPVSGQPVAAGNGDNALAIADLAKAGMFGTFTASDYYAMHIARVGADAQSYTTQSSNQKTVVQQLNNMRNSTSGVSMDEELSRMLQYQRSYQAAARMVTTMDGLLDTIINQMGAR